MLGDESFAKQTTDKDNYKCKSCDSLGNTQLNMHLQASSLKLNVDTKYCKWSVKAGSIQTYNFTFIVKTSVNFISVFKDTGDFVGINCVYVATSLHVTEAHP